MKTLIAGFGSELRGDDGFGIAVMRRLAERGCLEEDVELLEVGTGGIRLAQHLLGSYQRLIVVDAIAGDKAAGALYIRRVESVAPAADIDLHLAVPGRALAVAQALGALPPEVYLVGCQPLRVEDLSLTLSPPVEAAVDRAVEAIHELLAPLSSRKEA